MNLSLLRQKRQTIILIILFFIVITTVVTIFQDFKYEVKSKVLLVENYPENTDPYSVSKSSERLTNVLAEVVKSNVFYQNALDSGFNIEKDYFKKSSDPRGEIKAWQKTVYPKAINDLGAIEISVLHTNKYQAEQIAKAVSFTLANKHGEFHGSGGNVSIKEIDTPVASDKIVSPNIPLNYALTFLVGFLAALMYVYLFPEEEYDLKILGKKRRAAVSIPFPNVGHNMGGQIRFEAEQPKQMPVRNGYARYDDLDEPRTAVELGMRNAAMDRVGSAPANIRNENSRPPFSGNMENVLK